MARNLAFGGVARPAGRPSVRLGGHSVSCVASLAFVIVLGVAFWAGAVWLGQILLRMGAAG